MGQARPLVRTVTVRRSASPSERARVRALLLGLRSRYVVPVLGVDEDDEGFVVRYDAPDDVATLAARGARGPALTLPDVVRVAVDTAWGLAAGAAAGLVHGRLDATQIVLGDGPARVLGFGLATLDAAPPPAAGSVAPEVRTGGQPTEAADLWSLGALVRDLVAGLEPPLALADLIARMLDPLPSRRPKSARAVATRLVSLRLAPPHVDVAARAVPPARAQSRAGRPGASRPGIVVPAGAPTATPSEPTVPAPATGDAGADPVTALAQPAGAAGSTQAPPGSGSSTAPAARPHPRRGSSRRGSPRLGGRVAVPAWVRQPLSLAVAIAVVVAAATLVALTTRGSGAARRALAPPTTVAPDASAKAPAAPARHPAVPLPIVAGAAPVDPVAAARLSRLSLVPTDVAAHASVLAVPTQSNFDAVLRALYAECDYFTPVGQQPSAHQFSGFVDGDVEVFDDLTAYPVGVPGQVISGVAVAIDKCPTIRVASGSRSAAPAEFAVRRVPPPAGVPSDAVAMTYLRTDEPDVDVRAVFLETGTTLRVVLALAPSFGESEADWSRAAAHAWTRLANGR